MKNTRSIHISDAVNFHHKFITAPNEMPEDIVITAAKNLTMVLLTTTLDQLNITDKHALKRCNDIFTTVLNSKNQSQTSEQ